MEQNRMQGFQPARRTFRVRYEDYPGLLIVMKSTKLKKLTAINKIAGRPDDASIGIVFDFFSSRIISWNMIHPDLDDDMGTICEDCGLSPGQLMPSTAEYVACLDIDFVMRLILGWVSVLTSVPAPKGQNFSNTEMPLTNGDETGLSNLGNLARQTTLPQQSFT